MKRQELNLDGNNREKRVMIVFLVCSRGMLEAALKKKHIEKCFLESGMIDKATGTAPVFEKLQGTCKRYKLFDSNIGISTTDKDHCCQPFQCLMKIQLENSQITYPEMKDAGLHVDIYSRGNEIFED